MDLELRGRTALVTGGSRGIGKAVALELAREGVRVAICARTAATVATCSRELADQTGSEVLGLVADTSRADDTKRLVAEAVEAFGRLDILVNNAARVGGGAVPDTLEGVADDLLIGDIETKILGYVRCARAAAPHMKRNRWGRIINVSGMASRVAAGVSGGIRNAAISNLTKVLSDELGPWGITVNCVHPSTTETETFDERMRASAERQGIAVPELKQRMAANNAIRRLVTPQDIAWAVTFLCSPKSTCITGENISTSGGSTRAVFY